MGTLQRAEHRVRLADGGEARPIVIEGHDARHLGQRDCRIGAAAEFQLHLHRVTEPVPGGAAQHRAGMTASAIDGEREPHRSVVWRRAALVGAEAELGGRPQRERTPRDDFTVIAHCR
jgi:hypothetical protein